MNIEIILKEAHLGRDSLVAVTLVLNRMAQDESFLSKIFSDLPQFKIIKDKTVVIITFINR